MWLGLLVDRIGAKNTGILAQLIVIAGSPPGVGDRAEFICMWLSAFFAEPQVLPVRVHRGRLRGAGRW